MFNCIKTDKLLKKIIYYKNINKLKLKNFNNIFIKSGILKFKKKMSFDFFNIKVDEQKEFKIALQNIFGISLSKTNQLYKLLGLNIRRPWHLKQIEVKQIYQIKLYLPDIALFDSDLKRLISNEKEKFLELKCFKRNRFLLNLPVNGQRTRSNAKTRKKLNG